MFYLKLEKEKIFMRAIRIVTPLIVILLILSVSAYGQQFSPPHEAYKACEGKKAGDASQFASPSGKTVSGICKEVDGKLVLQSDRHKGKPHGKRVAPPPEAYKACEGKKAGDASQFIGPNERAVNGICKEVDGKLVLQPDRPKAVK
jgi:hypothetical protein